MMDNIKKIIENNETTQSVPSPLNFNERACLMAFLFIICFLGIVGNTWIIVIIIRNKKMRAPYYLLVANLILCDIIRSMVVMPLTLITLILNKWSLGNFLCQLQGLFTVGLNSVTLLTLAALAVEKYFCVVYPMKRYMNAYRCAVIIFIIWIISILYGGIPLISQTFYHYREVYFSCGLPKSGMQMMMYIFSIAVLIMVPLLIMVYCYWNIFATLKKQFNNLKSMTNQNLISSLKLQRKMVILNLLTLAIFLACWLPVIVAMIIAVAVEHERDIPRGLSAAALWCAFTGSFWNPILYVTRNTKIRYHTMRTLFCIKDTAKRMSTRHLKALPRKASNTDSSSF